MGIILTDKFEDGLDKQKLIMVKQRMRFDLGKAEALTTPMCMGVPRSLSQVLVYGSYAELKEELENRYPGYGLAFLQKID